jgi:hypothetical protein
VHASSTRVADIQSFLGGVAALDEWPVMAQSKNQPSIQNFRIQP